MERLICVLIGYAFGLFQTAYLLGKLHNIDIRDYGSGNAGTTNALRVLGKKAGIITYLGDCLKAIFAGIVIRILYSSSNEVMIPVLLMYSGCGVVLGHNYPFYLKFKGGKGIAALSGMIAAFDIRLALIVCFIFLVVVSVTRYVSLASLVMMSCFLLLLILGIQFHWFVVESPYRMEMYALGSFLTGLAFYKHKENIKRLIEGNERKVGQKIGA